MASELQLIEIARQHKRAVAAAKESEEERDAAIRDALSNGAPRARVVEIFGLSPQRIDQIRRGARI